jgi:hypothetical protein
MIRATSSKEVSVNSYQWKEKIHGDRGAKERKRKDIPAEALLAASICHAWFLLGQNERSRTLLLANANALLLLKFSAIAARNKGPCSWFGYVACRFHFQFSAYAMGLSWSLFLSDILSSCVSPCLRPRWMPGHWTTTIWGGHACRW